MSRRQKARDLVELAVDERTPEGERLNAALRAVKLIHKYDLLASPLDVLDGVENETVQAARGIAETLLNPSFGKNVRKIASQLGRRKGHRR